MQPSVRPFHLVLLVSAFALPIAQADSGLFQALTDAGASQFAQAIQTDAEFLDLIAAGEIGTLFAPIDSPAHAQLLLQRDNATSISSKTMQASKKTQLLKNIKTNTGTVVETVDTKDANLNGTAQSVVTNPSNSTTSSRRRDLEIRDDGVAQNSLVQISSGLGDISNILKADIPFKRCGNSSGVIHLVDKYFTVPQLLSASAEALGLTTFNTLAASSNLASELDSTPSITVFIPSNEAFAAANLSQPTAATIGLLRGLVVRGFVGYLPLLNDGARLVTESGSTLTITRQGTDVFVNGVRIVKPNIILRNGVAHVLGQVSGEP